MNLIIRDDDVSYFTKLEDLERWYSDIWDKTPIHLAVIPLIWAGGDETPLDRREDKLYSIKENKKLCDYLRKKKKEGKVVIWQHGLTHQTKNGKFECERSYKLIRREISLGYAILKREFGKISVFVAPHDRFSKSAIKKIEELKMDICRGFSPLPREYMFRQDYLTFFLITICQLLFFGRELRYYMWFDFNKHKELYSYRIGQINSKNMDKIIDWHTGDQDEVLCVTCHHRSMSIVEHEKLKQLVIRR